MNSEKFFYKRLLTLVIILTFIAGLAQAQNTGETINPLKKDSVDQVEKAKRRLDERIETMKKSNEGKQTKKDLQDSSFDDPMLPESPNALLADSLTNKKYQAALQEYYDYHIYGLKHRMKVFSWQLFSSKLIFVVVLILVFAGIYFAAVQFHVGIKQAREKSEEYNDRTELSASMEGIKVSSPVLGVIILVISLAFFYFYLVYVFPIEDIF